MTTGPSTATAPYLLGSEPNVSFTSILSVGDQVGFKSDGVTPYRMVGIPDGLGAFDNGNGTVTLFMNHELGNTAGIVRAHGAAGSFISQLVINKSTLAVESAKDAINTVQLWNDTLNDGVGGFEQAASYAIGRLCSADLANTSAYAFESDGVVFGTTDRIFMTGEEIGVEGKQFGVVVSGAEAGTAYELAYTGLFSWENSASSNYAQLKTISIGTDDGQNGQVYVYIGEKQTVGNTVEKAGLVGGSLFGIKVSGLDANANNESNTIIPGGSFSLVKLGADTNGDGAADGDVSKMTGAQLDAQSEALGVTSFLRPEDVSWDPTNPNVFYFATTNGFNSPSRLYRATLTDISNPELGGTIEAVLNGTEGQQMFDNITVNAEGKVILQEDVGNQAHIGRVWQYDPVTDKLTQIATHDPALFTAGLPGFKTQDEESSGVIDVTEMFGSATQKAYLLDVQSHNALVDPELVQDGQLLLMRVDTPVTQGANGGDRLFGSQANETFNGRGGDDQILAGSGNDKLDGGTGNDWLDAGRGDDNLIGGAGDDTLFGGDGVDKLQGGIGDDNLDGGDGSDNLNGGDGNDILTGGAANDILFGGRGADRFIFTQTTDSNRNAFDVIKDFKGSDEDIIDLSGIDANSALAGDQAFALVSSFTNQAGQLTISAPSGAVRYLYGDVNGDGSADFVLQVNSTTPLTSVDFIL
jgi:serralysin